jgi:hypothetical protein
LTLISFLLIAIFVTAKSGSSTNKICFGDFNSVLTLQSQNIYCPILYQLNFKYLNNSCFFCSLLPLNKVVSVFKIKRFNTLKIDYSGRNFKIVEKGQKMCRKNFNDTVRFPVELYPNVRLRESSIYLKTQEAYVK